jgi:hypothetical protein
MRAKVWRHSGECFPAIVHMCVVRRCIWWVDSWVKNRLPCGPLPTSRSDALMMIQRVRAQLFTCQVPPQTCRAKRMYRDRQTDRPAIHLHFHPDDFGESTWNGDLASESSACQNAVARFYSLPPRSSFWFIHASFWIDLSIPFLCLDTVGNPLDVALPCKFFFLNKKVDHILA